VDAVVWRAIRIALGVAVFSGWTLSARPSLSGILNGGIQNG